MALKNNKPEAKHFIANGNIESLNIFVAEKLSEGFDLLEAKLITIDTLNDNYIVFYIFSKTNKE